MIITVTRRGKAQWFRRLQTVRLRMFEIYGNNYAVSKLQPDCDPRQKQHSISYIPKVIVGEDEGLEPLDEIDEIELEELERLDQQEVINTNPREQLGEKERILVEVWQQLAVRGTFLTQVWQSLKCLVSIGSQLHC